MLIPGKRIADDDVYLSEDRFSQPKEVQKVMADMIAVESLPPKAAILDVGCATGEFIHFLQTRFPSFTYTGIDISEKMIAAALPRTPDAVFEVGSILDASAFRGRQFDLVLCNGTVQIFDDQSVPLGNLFNATKPGGVLMIHTLANTEPVDLITRYRYADDTADAWQLGWNVFSTRTFENILSALDPAMEMTWRPFHMPFARKKKVHPGISGLVELATVSLLIFGL